MNVKRWWSLVALVLRVGVVALAPASAEGEPPQILRLGTLEAVAGEWSFKFNPGHVVVLADEGPVTGFAFGPGRVEVAYCAPAGREGRWGLWIVPASFPEPEMQEAAFPNRSATRRVLWTAPAGVTLEGPVQWAPDGSRIAVRASAEGTSGVVTAQYPSGEGVWVCRGAEVVELAWDARGERMAYVTEEEAGRAIWLQTLPPGEARRLGGGGCDLRWSADGESLRWLRPKSETVWVEATWNAATGEVTEADPQPARPEGAMWSPDGRLCAVLEPGRTADGKQLVIYPAGSTTGEEVALPYVNPERLLGWSPDSRLIVVLGDLDFPVAVAASQMPEGYEQVIEVRGEDALGRAAICGFPVDPEAGPPSWSSSCDMLAYVMASRLDEWPAGQTSELPTGCLVAGTLTRTHLGPPAAGKAEAEQVLSNMKHVTVALQMYLYDNNDVFPPSGESEEVWRILDEYVKNRSVFMRPGTEDEMVTQYLVPPGVRLADDSDPARFPVAVVDYLPDVYVVAYADGHAEIREKGDDYWEELVAPWREYWEEREQEGG